MQCQVVPDKKLNETFQIIHLATCRDPETLQTVMKTISGLIEIVQIIMANVVMDQDVVALQIKIQDWLSLFRATFQSVPSSQKCTSSCITRRRFANMVHGADTVQSDSNRNTRK